MKIDGTVVRIDHTNCPDRLDMIMVIQEMSCCL